MPEDASNGYEAVAEEFMAVRSTSGRAVVRKWAASLPRACSIVDIGAGHGDRTSWSLGSDQYRNILARSGFRLIDEYDEDEPGGTHYYEAQKE